MADVTLSPEIAAQNKGPAIVATSCSLTALATVFVAARLFTRAKLIGKMGLDDWFLLGAIICSYISLGLSTAAVKSGDGKHFQLLDLDQKSGAIKYTIAGFCPGIFSFALPKLAVISLLTKLLNPSRIHRIFLWVLGLTTLMVLFGCVIILYAQCTPSASQWDFSITEKTCWSKYVLVNYAIFSGSLSAFTDLYLAVYPSLVLWKLQMSLRKKLVLSISLGLGVVATVVAIYKTTRIPGLASPDFSYDTCDLVIWTSIEGNTIIMATCIPVLRPLADLVFGKKVFGSSANKGYGSKGYDSKGYGSHSGHVNLNSIELSNVKHGNAKGTILSSKRGGRDPMKVDSQESILGHDNTTTHGSNKAGWIQRTDDVSVSYDDAPGSRKGENQW
ncbi:hypothetical protein GQ43DRAFT_380589 [Delitschia confertaspora ATCC 74209]|uniref:Rhodopsin domain-containing protein n=1 Tax=Delitschia confertaspora ATCC 74209 TaxID=1513339 RepID=A0A9P4MNX4_9PLEO|nr:hypothetical protein GQ43DRAFT_380589 [Delitschia confertaspora ATCC 74209]